MTTSVPLSHREPVASGETNENPRDIGLLSLLVEDFCTHDRNLLEPGFWAVAFHRIGNARMDVKPRWLRAPISLLYRSAFRCVDLIFGIELPYTVRVGRRVRIWHHGGIVISARGLGDDVHIRHNTTLGLARRSDPTGLPIIGARVDIGVGAAILGAVTVGDDSVIGAGSVVVRDVPAGATVAGVPARELHPQPPRSSTSSFRLRRVDLDTMPTSTSSRRS